MKYAGIEWDGDDVVMVSDEKEVEKDKKYEVVLAPSFPEEYRAAFEDILKVWVEDKNK